MPELIPFRECNAEFGKEHCYDLPAQRATREVPGMGRVPVVLMCWRFTEPELERIRETGVVWVSVIGTAPQPITVEVEQPK